jgi:hypothetical protein
VFRFKERSRLISIRHEGSNHVLEIEPEWNMGKLALALGAILYALYQSYLFGKIHLHPGGFESIARLIPIAELVTIVLAVAIAKDAALESLSKEEVRVNHESGTLTIMSRLWKINQTREFPIAEIKNLHSEHSNWLNDRDRKAVEFTHGKYGYRFAHGTSNEDRAKIVQLLENAGVSTLDKSEQSTSYSLSTPPR